MPVKPHSQCVLALIAFKKNSYRRFEVNENLRQGAIYTCNPGIQETRALMSFRPDLGIY